MSSVPDQLQKLVELRASGVLTDEEFEEQKQILLAAARTRSSQTASAPTLAKEVGAYRLLSFIGEGGMGRVHRGRHRNDTIASRQGGDVAIKVIHAQYSRNADFRARFEREAALGLKLDHPNIVRVHDLVVDGGNLALVMDYVDGQPLSDLIGENVGPIQWDRVWPFFQDLLEAVGYAHEQGVVHRDLKPENVLVTSEGVPHVIDFGIAKDLTTSATRTGTGMGTVEYMAPEQYTDAKEVDLRADIYSLGMILYEMLTGRLPWDSEASEYEILRQKAESQLVSPLLLSPAIPIKIAQVLRKALSPRPSERIDSTNAFASSLNAASIAMASPIAKLSLRVERASMDVHERSTMIDCGDGTSSSLPSEGDEGIDEVELELISADASTPDHSTTPAQLAVRVTEFEGTRPEIESKVGQPSRAQSVDSTAVQPSAPRRQRPGFGRLEMVAGLLVVGAWLAIACWFVAKGCSDPDDGDDTSNALDAAAPVDSIEGLDWSIDASAVVGELRVSARSAKLYPWNDTQFEAFATVPNGAHLPHFGKDQSGAFYRTTDSGRHGYILVADVNVRP